MALVRYEPWNMLEQMRHDMDRIFANRENDSSNSDISQWSPAVDIKETDDNFVIQADVPGVNPKDIEVHMENGMLTIRGERQSETKEEEKGYRRVERVSGSFYRRFTLPDTADAEKISAKSKDGVLEITIPKQEKEQPRRIEIKH